MLATKVICPHCAKHLKTSKPLTVGHRVLCSRCGRSFAVPADALNGAAAPPEVRTHPQPSPRPHAAPVETAPPVELARGADAAPLADLSGRKRQTLWIGVVFGGLLLLLGATLAMVVYFATRKDPGEDQLQASASTPSEAETQGNNSSPSDNNGSPSSNRRAADSSPPAQLENDPPTWTPPPEPEPEPVAAWLPPEQQKQVNEAIERGVTHLKKVQGRDGAWGGRVGLAALPGLTLLECGVPADDIRIRKALNHVRRAVPHLNTTYDLALTILFLDRLGDPSDEKLIRTCALRLVAGQTQAGGWTYGCPIPNGEQEKDLLMVMQQMRPKSAKDLFAGSAPLGFITQGSGAAQDKPLAGEAVESKLLPEGGSTVPLPDPEAARKALARLPDPLRKLPALQPPEKSHQLPAGDVSDNSNTQFAILGLSAANKHHLPLDRALALIAQRFHKSEARKGGWGYQYAVPTPDAHVTHSMTGAGLLGLAVGLGLAADHVKPQRGGRRAADPDIEKGFTFLGTFIGKPLGAKRPRNRGRVGLNYYTMWSIERCGVLFNRREIAGQDWYPWGAELLVDHQNDDGSWSGGSYPAASPVPDTCFALLFLKRANLAKNLTKKLEFFMEGKKLQGP